MSTAVALAPNSFGLPMGGTMARRHQGWSQDVYSPRQNCSGSGSCLSPQPETFSMLRLPRERIQLPGPSNLIPAWPFSPPLSFSSYSNSNSSRSRSSSSSALPLARDTPLSFSTSSAAWPSPVSQTPPQLPTPSVDGHGRAGSQAEAKPMSITSLLSEETATAAVRSCRPTTKAPMLSPARSVAASPCRYRIRVRQQPVAARSCGFGERDRRVVDPPPIVQLTMEDGATTATARAEEMRQRQRQRCHQFAVLHCSIWDETGEQDSSAMPEDYRQQRRLMGTLVSSPFVGQDEHGAEGCFFCFPDLSCRTPGAFRLKFVLVVLDPLGMRAGGSSPVQAVVMSDVFTVYNAKDFPGMQASTALTRRLKAQGCLISIKKGNDKTSPAHGRDESDDKGPEKGRKRTRR